MRDKCDLHTLLASGDLSHFSAPIDKKLTEPIRKLHKLADVGSLPFPLLSHCLTRCVHSVNSIAY